MCSHAQHAKQCKASTWRLLLARLVGTPAGKSPPRIARLGLVSLKALQYVSGSEKAVDELPLTLLLSTVRLPMQSA